MTTSLTTPSRPAHSSRRARLPLAAAPALLASALAGCATSPPLPRFEPQERFDSGTTYSRLFDARPDRTCEAARRALLSQGYIITTHTPDLVEGHNNFQPAAESHLQMVIRVVCVPESPDGRVSLGFVTAVQDSYTLKKSNNSASVGVGAIGSVSLPLTASSESLVKVGSETIATNSFYESFFDLMRRHLLADDSTPDAAPR